MPLQLLKKKTCKQGQVHQHEVLERKKARPGSPQVRQNRCKPNRRSRGNPCAFLLRIKIVVKRKGGSRKERRKRCVVGSNGARTSPEGNMGWAQEAMGDLVD